MNGGYTLKIVSGYKGMLEYIKKAKANSYTDLKELWHKHVIDPYWDEWASGQFNEERTREQIQNPVTDLDKLSNAVELLNSSEINSIIENSYKEMTEILPPPENNKVVCVYANPYLGENVGGVVGSCVGDNILIQINSTIPNWEAIVPWVLAHEYHHTIWGYNYFYKKGNSQADLLTGLIIDGQADSFAKSLNKSMDAPWINALSEQQELEQWTIMQEYLSSTDEDIYCRFFFGDERKNTPGCTAYTIGYHIVQAYLKTQPEISFTELLDKDAYEILIESGYKGLADEVDKVLFEQEPEDIHMEMVI